MCKILILIYKKIPVIHLLNKTFDIDSTQEFEWRMNTFHIPENFDIIDSNNNLPPGYTKPLSDPMLIYSDSEILRNRLQ